MSQFPSITVGSIGQTIDLPVTDENGQAVDISTASPLNLLLESPNDITATYSAAAKPGEPTTVRYTLDGTEFVVATVDRPGWWQAQVQYTKAGVTSQSWPLKRFFVGRRLT